MPNDADFWTNPFGHYRGPQAFGSGLLSKSLLDSRPSKATTLNCERNGSVVKTHDYANYFAKSLGFSFYLYEGKVWKTQPDSGFLQNHKAVPAEISEAQVVSRQAEAKDLY